MKISKKQLIWSLILLVIIAACIILYYIGKANGWFFLFESREKIQEYVASFGALAPLVFMLLQFLQVIISPIPGSLTTVAGGFLFGFFNAFLISTVAVILGSLCAFLLGKIFGRPLVERIVGQSAVEKYMMTVSSRQKTVLILMFLLPFFPDDLLCLLAGLTAMRLPSFALLVITTRPWGLLFSALVGAGFIEMPEWGWILLIVFAAIIFVLSIKYAPVIEERTKNWLEKKFLKPKDPN